FIYKPRSAEWMQVTNTVAPVENHRPTTIDGRRIIFDSTGDLQNDTHAPPASNADGNRELFLVKLRGGGALDIRQLTDTVGPADGPAPAPPWLSRRPPPSWVRTQTAPAKSPPGRVAASPSSSSRPHRAARTPTR